LHNVANIGFCQLKLGFHITQPFCISSFSLIAAASAFFDLSSLSRKTVSGIGSVAGTAGGASLSSASSQAVTSSTSAIQSAMLSSASVCALLPTRAADRPLAGFAGISFPPNQI
jgi:hypothetical protein